MILGQFSSADGEPILVPGLEEIALKSGEKVWSYAADFRGCKRECAIMTRNVGHYENLIPVKCSFS